MLIEFPILTYIVLLPAVGAVFTFITGSDRAAKAVALTFSLIVLGLSTVLLTGFLWPNVISLPTMTTVGNHTYFAVEESPWVPSLSGNYILGADELSVGLVFLNTLLTPLALAIGWDHHHRVRAFFGTNLPTWPLHTWLPAAPVADPTGGSVILAGILLKLGGYGLIRFNVQMIPQAAVDMYWLLALAGVISILYGAVVCLAQDDLKRLVAFSSVSHMGFVTLGIAAGVYGFTVSGRGAVLGFSGAIFQMFAHGLVSAALFMVAGSLGHKIGTRNISELGGIAKRGPRIATFMLISLIACLCLPGPVAIVAGITVFIGVYAAFGLLVFVPILTVVLTAAYYIWAMQRAIFGPLNPQWETMPDLHRF